MRFLILVAVASVIWPAYAQTVTTTPIADAATGNQVTLEGVVQRIEDDDEFILADSSGSIEVYLGPNRVPVVVGETVFVSGFVDDDQGSLDLCATSIMRADGSSIQIANCDD